jgi:hypothetical protein
MFPLWFTLLGDSFVFFEHGSFHFVPCIPLFFWVLWFIYGWHGFIIYPHGLQQGNVTLSTKERKWAQLLNITFAYTIHLNKIQLIKIWLLYGKKF